MMNFFTAAWAWIVWAVQGLMPFKKGMDISPAVRWVVWIVLDLLMLTLLWLLNEWSGVAQWVQRMPFNLAARAPWLRDIFLPILGQLFTFMGIVLYWFYLLWFADPDDSPHPDIDQAWHEGIRALEKAGIQLPRVPLFLVLGRPESSEEQLFDASGLKLVVRQTPANPEAPLHVYADREAVYVTCRGASVLGKLARILALEEISEATQSQGTTEDLTKTHVAGKKEQVIIEMLRASMGQEATVIQKRAIRRADIGRPLGNDFLSDPKEVTRFKSRLAHLCRLIARDRQPYCAANGILMLIPLAATDTPGEAQLTAQASQEDLAVVRQEMKLDCPLVTLVVDMEDLPGFPEFMRRQPPKELGNRRGNGFPMSTRLSREEVLDHIRISLSWVCTTYLQDSVYRIFEGDTPTNQDVSRLFTGNSRLVLLLDEMNERADALNMIVQQVVGPERYPLFRYAGCYLAATGEKGNQAFVAGVFQKLVKEQSCVSWTQAALTEDEQCHTWANYYFLLAGVLVVLLVLLSAFLLYRGL